ncbi:MAG: N-acetyltransferase family protein [Pseudomonadota bacterium]
MVTIRTVRPGDIPAIQVIYAYEVEHGLASFEETPPDITEMERRRAHIVSGRYPYIVATDGADVVGYAYASAYRPRPAYRFTVENSVYVARHAHRRGVGKALLSALIAECEAGPWRQMLAVIGDRENHGSIALHTALGFSVVGIIESTGYKLGQWVDTVLMQRGLGPSSTAPPDAQ